MRLILAGIAAMLLAVSPGAPARLRPPGEAAFAASAGGTGLPSPPPDLARAVASLRGGTCGSIRDELRQAGGEPSPGGARAAYLLGRCLETEGRYDEAHRSYLDAAGRHPTLAGRARLAAGRVALRAGDTSGAAMIARPTPGTSATTSARLRLTRSEALRRQGLHREAAAEAGRVASARWPAEGPHLDRIQAEAWWLLAQASEGARDLRAARSAYAMVWWGFPDNPWVTAAARRLRALSSGRGPVPTAHARAVRAVGLLKRWEPDAAERELALAVKGPLPASIAGEAWYRLGLLRLGTRAGVDALEHAVRFAPERDRALYWLGVARLRTGRGADAVATWARLRAAYPDSLWTARALATQGRLAEGAGRWQDADHLYALVIDRYPASPRADDARWRRAWMRRQRGLRDDARALFMRYGRAVPGAPRAAAHLYWAARLSAAAQERDSLLGEVTERYPLTFYGQRARARLGLPLPADPSGSPSGPLSPERFHPAYEELAALGAMDEALEEVEAQLTDDASESVRGAAAELYAHAGDVPRAVAALEPVIDRALSGRGPASAQTWRLAYPRPFWAAVTREAERGRVDPLLLVALMREESRFDPGAVSTANAVGLMQLLPSTARGVLGRPVPAGALKQPALNIRTGTAYLAGLLRRYEGSVPLAVAAYNAGPGGVRRHAALARADVDRFVEELPYAETRAYVQRVLQSYGIYRWLYR